MFDLSENDIVTADAESIARNTEWYNPTEDTVVLELHVATPSPATTRHPIISRGDKPLTFRERTGKMKYVIGPKKTALISSEFDKAIQVVRDGVIQSGMGPQLVNKGWQEAPKMHHSLDVAKAERLAAQTAEQIAYKAKAESEVKLALALAKLAELEEKLTSPTAAPSASSVSQSPSSGSQSAVTPLPKKKD